MAKWCELSVGSWQNGQERHGSVQAPGSMEIAVRLQSNKENSYIGKKGPGARWRQKHTDLKKWPDTGKGPKEEEGPKLFLGFESVYWWEVYTDEKNLMLGKIEGRRRRGRIGWDSWMASPTQWTWVWVNSGNWWWTGRPGMLQSMGLQSRHDWATELNWTELMRATVKLGKSCGTGLWEMQGFGFRHIEFDASVGYQIHAV